MHVLKYNETHYVVYPTKSIIKKVIKSQTVQAERNNQTKIHTKTNLRVK